MKRGFDWQRFSETEIQVARDAVADAWEQNARDTFTCDDPFVAHFTESEKEAWIARGVRNAEDIRAGRSDFCFTIAQRLWEFLTGECLAFLPKYETAK